MPAVTTEGIILKRINFGEADRVLTVFTDRFGKISVIAKGVRRITSRRAGNVEVCNRVKLHLFKTKNFNLNEAESIETYQPIKENLTLSTHVFHILELIDKLLPEEQVNRPIYDLLAQTLEILKDKPRQLYIRAFEVKLLTLLGFWSVNSINGLKPDTEVLLERLQREGWENISQIKVSEQVGLELERILRYYIEKILESSLKSSQMIRKMKNG